MGTRTVYLENRQEELKSGLEKLLSVHDFALTEEKKSADICILAEPCEEETLKIRKDGKSCSISFHEKAHFFRGVSLILQNIEKESWNREETVYFHSNGVMLDCSRNSVPTVNTIKKYIVRLAAFGMNRLYLYVEDTLEIEGYPYWGYLRGRFSKAEMKECDAFGKEFGVTLIPCIQTLAHLRSALKQPAFEKCRDIDDILLLEIPETEELLKALLDTVKECFSCGIVHLGMDEAENLGRGRFLDKNGWQNPAAVMKRHLEWLTEECRKRELSPIIWSDMYLKFNFGSEGYYSLAEDAEPLNQENLSSETALCYWDYYHEGVSFYEKYLNLHQKMGNPVVFAGGAWTWNGIAPGISKAVRTTLDALRACQNKGIRDVFCTAWMDNSAETPLETVLPAMALFGEFGFNRFPDKDWVAERFAFVLKRKWEQYCLLDAFDNRKYKKEELEQTLDLTEYNKDSENPSKIIFYEDNFMGIASESLYEEEMQEQYEMLKKQLSKIVEEKSEEAEDRELFKYYGILAELLSKKANINRRIRNAYQTGDKDKLCVCRQELLRIGELAENLRIQRQKLWMEEYKPFGYELLDIRFAGVSARARSEAARIEAFTEGKLEHIEELEVELLPCRVPNLWDRMISAGNMEGV